MEKMARQIAAAQVTHADSHIIPAYLSPGLREAIEADTVPEIIPGREEVQEYDRDGRQGTGLNPQGGSVRG